ncbi:MAG: hypothetical protein R3C59_16910 [Planctomycetaceae bacterium]
MQYSYANIRAMTMDRLIEIHDARSLQVDPGLDFFRNEIARREQESSTQLMTELTQSMAAMTRRIELATYIAMTSGVISLCIAIFK